MLKYACAKFGKVSVRFFTPLLLGVLALGTGHASAEPAYTATVQLKEAGLAPRPCGTVAVAGEKALIEVDLGKPGVFRAFVRPDQKVMTVVSDTLKAYATVPLKGDERDMRLLATRVAESVGLYGMPVLVIREDGRQSLGAQSWNGRQSQRAKSRFVAECMGAVGMLNLIVWEHADFAPFPVRIQEIRSLDKAELTGTSVEMIDIKPGTPDVKSFDPPTGYTRYASVLDLIVYALARQ